MDRNLTCIKCFGLQISSCFSFLIFAFIVRCCQTWFYLLPFFCRNSSAPDHSLALSLLCRQIFIFMSLLLTGWRIFARSLRLLRRQLAISLHWIHRTHHCVVCVWHSGMDEADEVCLETAATVTLVFQNFLDDLYHICKFNPGLWAKTLFMNLYMTISPLIIFVSKSCVACNPSQNFCPSN